MTTPKDEIEKGPDGKPEVVSRRIKPATPKVNTGEDSTDNEDVSLLIPEKWVPPKWLSYTGTEEEDKAKKKIETYDRYLLFEIRTNYLKVDIDFYSFYYSDPEHANRVTTTPIIYSLLSVARASLEKENPTNLLEIQAMLDQAARYMVWLTPPEYARAQAAAFYTRLEDQKSVYAAPIKALLDKTQDAASLETYEMELVATVDEFMGIDNENELSEKISNGLQIRRLRMLRNLAWIIMGVFLVIAPFITKNNNDLWQEGVISSVFVNLSPEVVPWLIIIGIVLVGAFGGFFSGLLQVRSTKVGLLEYEESMLKFQLKPVLGGILAMLVYIFLTWDILPGIEIKAAGTFVFIAFLSGFSERYFLNLLQISPEEERELTPKSLGTSAVLNGGGALSAQQAKDAAE